jgi:rRNA maturation protein Nop10
MAAFCSCCGAEITLKAEACPVCGAPRHGMLPRDFRPEGDPAPDGRLEGEQKPRRQRL